MTADTRVELSWTAFGAVLGILFAWISEWTGHPPWAILLMLAYSVLPIFVIPPPNHSPLRELSVWCFSQGKPTRAGFVFILIAITLIVEHSLGTNPRSFNYLPFLPAVVASNILFGTGFALLATVLSLLMADYLFAAPVSEVFKTAWEYIALWASFSAIGAAIAWALSAFIGVLSQHERETFES